MAASTARGSVFCWFLLVSGFIFVSPGAKFLITTAADDVVFGCGGFVKSDFEKPIDFSRVEIKLYSKQGVLKYPTDCAPNNGYYLIPVYDKGDYILKVEPPKGWVFQPESIELHVDGISDACSQSRDINFHFKGFSISGQLISRGSVEGPTGISIELALAASSSTVIQTVKTDFQGNFVFVVVPPGEYVVRAMANGWNYDRQISPVTVAGDNGRLESHLIISGYQVWGRVIGDEDEPILGVNFVLYGDSDAVNVKPRGCEPGLPIGFDGVSGDTSLGKLIPLCYVTSSKDGRFSYTSITPGQYSIVPFYKGKNIKFDVVPPKLNIVVMHKPLILQQTFKVEGFSVSGRVRRSSGGDGVVGVTVLVDGKKVTTTKDNGIFHLENIRAGSYKVQIIADDMQFSPSTVKITPNSPNIPDLIATSFHVCGILEGDETAIYGHPMTIVFTGVNDRSARRETDSDNSGKFCIWLPSGDYLANVESNTELVIFTPSEIRVAVRNAPVSGVRFRQFKARVTGNIVCLNGNCIEPIQVILRPMDLSLSALPVRRTTLNRDSSFEFDGVLPGEYDLSVSYDSWCWRETSRVVDVIDKDVGGVQFFQNGFLLNVIASHQTMVTYRTDSIVKTQGHNLDNNNNDTSKTDSADKLKVNDGELNIVKGNNKFCLKWPGRYDLHPVGCHIFGGGHHFTFDTSEPKMITLDATRHLLSGKILSDVDVDDVRIAVRIVGDNSNSDNGLEAILGPFTVKRRVAQNDYEYPFTYWAVPHKVIELTPQSEKLLFYPDKQRVTTIDDCMPHITEFSGKKGLFLDGGITPAIAGAKITIVAKDGSMEPIFLETAIDGRFHVGPLHDRTDYEIHAEKQGYVLTRSESDPRIFNAFKLAEISVTVNEEGTGRPLAGVLISISGHSEYRRNSLTGEDGTMVFSELGPGQFFLRAMMKEFQFIPVSKMVDVNEGATVNVVLQGKRIAFSCYGNVVTLTGDPEPGVVLEAIGQGECLGLQEETKTEVDGIYRVRGLKPGCVFEVRPKKSSTGINFNIERSAPDSRLIKVENDDVNGVNFIAFRPVLRMSISGIVITSAKHYGSLKVRLIRDDGIEHMSQSLPEGENFFHFAWLPMNDRRYTITIDVTSPRSTATSITYDYSVIPEVSFVANVSYRHFKVELVSKARHGDGDIAQGSYLALPLALLVLFAVYNHSKLTPMLQEFYSRIPELVRRIGNPVARFRDEVGIGSSSLSSGGSSMSGINHGGGGGNGLSESGQGSSFMDISNASFGTANVSSKKRTKPKKVQ